MDERKPTSQTTDKSNLIRTFAKDAASLGQAVPKEFTPAPKEIKKVAPKPVEKKKPLEQVLPTAVRKTKEDPSFVPVSAPAPEHRQEPKEPVASPLPFSVPIPSPMPKREQLKKPVPPPPPPQKPEPALSPLHTYTTDFAEKIDTSSASAFSVLSAQLDAGTNVSEKTRVPEKSKPVTLAFAAGVLLLLVGGGGVWFAMTTLQDTSVTIPALSVPSLVFADDRKELEGPDFSTSLVHALSDPLEEGGVRVVYSATASSTPKGIFRIPNEGKVLFEALNLGAPDLLIRNIENTSTAGIVRTNERTSPFFVLRASSYERTFSAMLQWENSMASDLALFFSNEQPVLETSGVTASSTPSVPVSFAPVFKDKVVDNYNMRVLVGRDGLPILCYGYTDKETLIIAKSPEVFVVLAKRIVSAP